MQKRGFVSHLFNKKWHLIDFLEPLAALPFAYGTIFIIEHGIDTYGLLLSMSLAFIYLPCLIVFFDRVVK